jgi:hypothetical protein
MAPDVTIPRGAAQKPKRLQKKMSDIKNQTSRSAYSVGRLWCRPRAGRPRQARSNRRVRLFGAGCAWRSFAQGSRGSVLPTSIYLARVSRRLRSARGRSTTDGQARSRATRARLFGVSLRCRAVCLPFIAVVNSGDWPWRPTLSNQQPYKSPQKPCKSPQNGPQTGAKSG